MESVEFRNGRMKRLEETYYGKPFFRKYVGRTEQEVAECFKKFPHPNIVKVYRVTPEYIDVELVSRKPPKNEEVMNNMAQLLSAKTHMHIHGIVYIDWKPENMGRAADGTLKIFDFDSCGFFRRNLFGWNIWREQPPFSYVLAAAMSARKRSPIAIDDWIFEHMLNPDVFEKYGPTFSLDTLT